MQAVSGTSVVVKATFVDLKDGQSLMEHFCQMRRSKSDSCLYVIHEENTYIPGKYSDEHEEENLVKEELRSTSKGSGTSQASDTVEVESEVSTAPGSPKQHRDRPFEKKDSQKNLVPKQSTVMMKNVPNNYTREMFLNMLNARGFAGMYDFVYLPHDFERNANLGYAFVNLVSSDAVDDFWHVFDGFTHWSLPSAKVCRLSWSGPHQGWAAHVERYRNSPVMHRSVPDEYKPVVFASGARQPFPSPTRKIKPPPPRASQ